MTVQRIHFLLLTVFVFFAATIPARAFDQDIQQILKQTLSEQETRINSQDPLENDSAAAPDVADSGINGLQRAEKSTIVEVTFLEKDYSERAGQLVRQFGYSQLWDGKSSPRQKRSREIAGHVPASYVLGAGDQLTVDYRGQESRSQNVFISRQGSLALPLLTPFDASGKTVSTLQAEVSAAAAKQIPGTEVFLSVGRVRLISVYVLGEVGAPGVKQLNAFASVLDALTASEGVKNSGSLRGIQLQRGDTSETLDVYQALLGAPGDSTLQLQDGDRLIVPPLGKTIAVVGDVQRPGIFELPGKSLSPQDALKLAGGTLRSTGNRILRLRLNANGQDTTEELDLKKPGSLQASDILLVQRRQQVAQSTVMLDGYVRDAGTRSLIAAPTLKELLGSANALKPDAYTPLAILLRRDASSGAITPLSIDLAAVFNGSFNMSLQNQDTLIVLGKKEIRYLESADVRAIIHDQTPVVLSLARLKPKGLESSNTDGLEYLSDEQKLQNAIAADFPLSEQDKKSQEKKRKQENDSTALLEDFRGRNTRAIASAPVCKGLRQLAQTLSPTQKTQLRQLLEKRTQGTKESSEQVTFVQSCPLLFDKYPSLLQLMLRQVVVINGEVLVPGLYPIADDVRLNHLLAAAEGLTESADSSRIEITQQNNQTNQDERFSSNTGNAKNIQIRPRNSITVFSKPQSTLQGRITLQGQFLHPGTYDIKNGEKLSDVIRRAGGLTDDAYAYGAIFTRVNLRESEKQSFERAARQLELALLSNVSQLSGANASATIQSVNQIIEQIRRTEPLGRLVIEADPAQLLAKPELDIPLEHGDLLYMPKRPPFIMVSGDVLNQGAQQFRDDWTAEDYLKAAGGLQSTADEGRIFAVLPNGQAQPVSISSWNYSVTRLPPGSLLFVPTDPLPLSYGQLARDSIGIVSQLAVSAASLAVINR
ncbi:MAG: SLBB domain-containing protein [Thalassospira sp.]|jgi:polysaccharide export outer membrane protein|nr:SLBB domain-containing protein [Thalassospira sp.]